MPFQFVLTDLLAQIPEAQAVIFLDDSGETVEVATTEHSPEDLKILGAYFGIALRRARELLEPTAMGDLRMVYLRHQTTHLHGVCLPDGYFLVLLQTSPALSAFARRRMRVAVADLERELFS